MLFVYTNATLLLKWSNATYRLRYLKARKVTHFLSAFFDCFLKTYVSIFNNVIEYCFVLRKQSKKAIKNGLLFLPLDPSVLGPYTLIKSSRLPLLGLLHVA